MALTEKQRRFVHEYTRDANGTQAAIRAGYPPTSAHVSASRMLSSAKVQEALKEHRAAIVTEADLCTLDVLRTLSAQVFCDRNEFVELQRVACRFCHGQGFEYQETPAERRARKKAHDHLLCVTPEHLHRTLPAFDEMGGVGYSAKRDPHPRCPECFGCGVERLVFKDTRKLSAAARCVFEGVDVSGGRTNLRLADRMKAIEQLIRLLGMETPSRSLPEHDLRPSSLTFVAVYPSEPQS